VIRFLLAVIAVLFAQLALAQTSVTLTSTTAHADSNGAQTSRQSISVRHKLNSTWAVDAGITAGRTDSTKSQTVREELAVSAIQPLAESITGSVRLAVGYKAVSRADAYEYYSVEPGINVMLAPNLTTGIGYRYRTAADSANADTSFSVRSKITYAVNRNNSIGIGHDSVRGDGAEHAWAIFYTHSF
jgi:hypothetical protein